METIHCIGCNTMVENSAIACSKCGRPIGYQGGTPLNRESSKSAAWDQARFLRRQVAENELKANLEFERDNMPLRGRSNLGSQRIKVLRLIVTFAILATAIFLAAVAIMIFFGWQFARPLMIEEGRRLGRRPAPRTTLLLAISSGGDL